MGELSEIEKFFRAQSVWARIRPTGDALVTIRQVHEVAGRIMRESQETPLPYRLPQSYLALMRTCYDRLIERLYILEANKQFIQEMEAWHDR